MKQLSSSELNSMSKEDLASMVLQMQKQQQQMQQLHEQLQQQQKQMEQQIHGIIASLIIKEYKMPLKCCCFC